MSSVVEENRQRRPWLNVRCQGVPQDGCSNRKRATTDSCKTGSVMLMNVDGDTNQLIQVGQSQTVQYPKRHDRDFEVNQFRQTKPVKTAVMWS